MGSRIKQGVLVLAFEGAVGMQELVAHCPPRDSDVRGFLWDLTRVRSLGLGFHDISAMIGGRTEAHFGHPLAIVAGAPEVFGIARIFQAISSELVAVLRSESDALDWIDAQHGGASPA